MIQIKNLSKKYNEFYALKDINLNLPSKGLIGISGESGCGKTTFLNALSLIDDNYEGEILINNKNIFKYSKKEKEKYSRNIGYVFQNPFLFEFCSVKDNIKLLSFIKGKNKKVEEVIKLVKLEKFQDKKVNKLSGGQRQRVSIAASLISKPNILLCDEPTGALDNENSRNIMSILKETSKDCLVIVVSHDYSLLKEYSDSIIYIKNGEISNLIKFESKSGHFNNQKKSLLNMIKFMFYFAFKNIFNHRKRTILTSLMISIGLIGFIISILLKDGFSSFFSSSFGNFETNKYMYCYSVNKSDTIEISIDTFEEDFKDYPNGYFYKYDFKDKRNKIMLNNNDLYLNFNHLKYLIKDNEKYLNNEIGLCCSKEYLDYIYYIFKVDNIDEINKKLKESTCLISFEYLDSQMNLTFDLRLKIIKESNSNYTYFLHSSPLFLKEYFKKYVSYNFEDNQRIVVIPYIVSEKIDKNNLLLDEEKKKYDYLFDNEIYDNKYDFVFKSNYYRMDIDTALEINEIVQSKYIYSMENGINTMGYFDDDLKFSSTYKEINGKEISFIPDDRKYESLNELSISRGLYDILKSEVINIRTNDSFLTFYVNEIVENDDLVIYQNSFWSYALFKDLFSFDKYECIALSIAFVDNDNKNIEYLNSKYSDFEFICPLKEMENEIENMVNKIQMVLVILSSFCMIISLFLMAIIVFINTIEQSKIIGFLRVNGIRKNNVVLIYLLESVIIGIISFIIASYFSFIFSFELNIVFNMLLENKKMESILKLKKDTLVNVFYLVITMSIISGIVPALIIANKNKLKLMNN